VLLPGAGGGGGEGYIADISKAQFVGECFFFLYQKSGSESLLLSFELVTVKTRNLNGSCVAPRHLLTRNIHECFQSAVVTHIFCSLFK